MDKSVIEASLVKGDAVPTPSHLANIRVHLNEIFAKVIIALCEGGSNSPTVFPGDEMFESELEESFIFVTHSAVKVHLIHSIPFKLGSLFILRFLRCFAGAEESYVTDLHGICRRERDRY